MCTRAQHTVYWQGMNNNYTSWSKESTEMSATPEWPFQQVCADYFHYKGQHYLTIGYILQLSHLFKLSFCSFLQERFQNYIFFLFNITFKTYPSSASTYNKITTIY